MRGYEEEQETLSVEVVEEKRVSGRGPVVFWNEGLFSVEKEERYTFRITAWVEESTSRQKCYRIKKLIKVTSFTIYGPGNMFDEYGPENLDGKTLFKVQRLDSLFYLSTFKEASE